MTQRPVGKADRDQVAALHAKGLSRNEIARQIGRSGRTVSRIAADLGITFERSPMVAAAAEAKRIDAKARRAQLALALLDDAARLREQLWTPCKVYNFGGRDNTYNETTLDEPSFRDKREIMIAACAAAERSVKLDEYDRSTGADDQRSMLVDLMGALGQAWRDDQ